MRKAVVTIDGRRCTVLEGAAPGPTLYWGVDSHALDAAPVTAGLVRPLAGRIVAYAVEDWNDAFSPWPAEGFGGQGPQTLAWLTQACIPQLEKDMPPAPRLLGGYSLAGLFSLWALYSSDMFFGAASCSGSLWYPGWEAWASARNLPQEACVYLSLGVKEERTRHPLMSAVGDATRSQYARLKADANVRACTLKWQPGGHFTETDRRTAEGFAWLMGQAYGMTAE